MRLSTTPVALLLGGVALSATLAGCASDAGSATEPSGGTGTTEGSTAGTPEAVATGDAQASTGAYENGEYSATGEYQSPGGDESIEVTVTLEDDVVTAVTVQPNATKEPSVRYQTAFAGGVAGEVEGVAIDELAVDKVAGSSLTSDGFNDAIEQIKGDAAA